MPATVEASLSGSWASLDNTEFSHDEDVRSEATDAGSLVDVNDGEDITSVTGEDYASDTDDSEHNENSASGMTVERSLELEALQDSEDDIHLAEADEDFLDHTLILDQKQKSPDGLYTSLSKTIKQFEDPSGLKVNQPCASSQIDCQKLVGNVKMGISERPTYTNVTAFHCLYFGTTSAQDCRADLMGKIGAALLASPDTKLKQKNQFSQFHIAPTAYGPGLKPSFADLIPSQIQMTLADVSLVSNTEKNTNNGIDIMVGRDNHFVSRSTNPATPWNMTSELQQPDLFIIHVSDSDMPHQQDDIRTALELSRRHSWPTIYVRNESGWVAPYDYPLGNEYNLCMVIELNPWTEPKDTRHQLPVDLNTLLNLDAGQLNAHIGYLQGRATLDIKMRSTQYNRLFRFLHRISQQVFQSRAKISNVYNASTSTWVLDLLVTGKSSQDYNEGHEKSQVQERAVSVKKWKANFEWRTLLARIFGISILIWVTCFVAAFTSSRLHPINIFQEVSKVSPSQGLITTVQSGVTASSNLPYPLSPAVPNTVPDRVKTSDTLIDCKTRVMEGRVFCQVLDNIDQTSYTVKVHRDGREIIRRDLELTKSEMEIQFDRNEMHGIVEIFLMNQGGTKTRQCGFVELSSPQPSPVTIDTPKFLEQYNHVLEAMRRPRRQKSEISKEASEGELILLSDVPEVVSGSSSYWMQSWVEPWREQPVALRVRDEAHNMYNLFSTRMHEISQRSRETVNLSKVIIAQDLKFIKQSHSKAIARFQEFLQEQKEVLANAQAQAQQARNFLREVREQRKRLSIGRG